MIDYLFYYWPVCQVISAMNHLPLLEISLRVKGQWYDESEKEKPVPTRHQGRHNECAFYCRHGCSAECRNCKHTQCAYDVTHTITHSLHKFHYLFCYNITKLWYRQSSANSVILPIQFINYCHAAIVLVACWIMSDAHMYRCHSFIGTSFTQHSHLHMSAATLCFQLWNLQSLFHLYFTFWRWTETWN